MKVMRKVLAILCMLCLLAAAVPAAADDSDSKKVDGFSTSYSYTFDYWGDVQMAPDPYRVLTVIDSTTFGIENLDNKELSKPQGLFIRNSDLYVVDTGNNRILQIQRNGEAFELVRIISSFTGSAEDYELAEDLYNKQEAYNKAVEARETAEKNLKNLRAKYTDLVKSLPVAEANLNDLRENEADEEEIQAAEEEIEKNKQDTETVTKDIRETNQQISEYQEKEALAQEEVTAAEERNRAAGCRIWAFKAWQKDGDGNVTSGMNLPKDAFADDEGNLYIADQENNRVIMVDKDLNLLKEFTKPSDATFNQNSAFLPNKIAVDVAGRVYVLATNVNKGFMKYENDCTFTGYIGANEVKVNMADYIWKRYFMSKEQRAASENFVPTEYENMYMDEKGFIYATTTVFSEYELLSDAAKPIRRLNGIGKDILIKNDRYPPIGDLDWKAESLENGPCKMTDITALENEIYVVVDRIRGRLFGYDSQGVMLWAFGTKGNMDGTFSSAVALDHMGYDLFVMDGQRNSITVFTPTEYGQLIYNATDAYMTGEYDYSAELWTEVMKLNANYSLAFRGIGRSLLRQEKYEEAMEYFERAYAREEYGRAFKQYRKAWVEKNIWWIIVLIAVLLIVPLVISRVRKTKWEVIMHEHSKVRK